jgi:hypothetical protein
MLVVASPVTSGDDVVEQAVERLALLLQYIDARLAQHLDGQRIEPLGVGTTKDCCKAALTCAHSGLPAHKNRTRIG